MFNVVVVELKLRGSSAELFQKWKNEAPVFAEIALKHDVQLTAAEFNNDRRIKTVTITYRSMAQYNKAMIIMEQHAVSKGLLADVVNTHSSCEMLEDECLNEINNHRRMYG